MQREKLDSHHRVINTEDETVPRLSSRRRTFTMVLANAPASGARKTVWCGKGRPVRNWHRKRDQELEKNIENQSGEVAKDYALSSLSCGKVPSSFQPCYLSSAAVVHTMQTAHLGQKSLGTRKNQQKRLREW